LSHLIDAQQGQKLQLGRLRSGVRGKRRLGNLGGGGGRLMLNIRHAPRHTLPSA
jgi:hypothetical protein